jgi:hypothetical protein
MKTRMSRHLRQFIAICAGATFVVGCAHTISLKVVDATTRQPLAGVSSRWLQYHHPYFSTAKQEGPTYLPPSDSNGVIKVAGMHRWWSSEFIFSQLGYSNVYGYYNTKSLNLADQFCYYPTGSFQDQFILKGDIKIADKTNEFFIVEMQRGVGQ